MAKKSIFFLMVLFIGISWVHIALADVIYCSNGQSCPVAPGYSCNANGVCVCQPGACLPALECGSTLGYDANCYQPCYTATPGTCPPSPDYCNVDGFCVCQPGFCQAAFQCGNSVGVDSNCGWPCNTATPGICPSGNYCNASDSCSACTPTTCILASSPVPASAAVPSIDRTETTDPVNIATGEDYFSSTDFSLSAKGPKLALSRQYRSFSTFIGMFGYGWRTDFDVNLTIDSSGDVIIYNGEGTGTYFMNNAGVYTPSPGNYSTITQNADNTFTLTDKNGIITHYDINGRLSSRTDRNGNALTFVYNPAMVGGSYIQDASGRQIKLYFDSNGHIISAQDQAGRTFQYGYDTNGNLVSITDPAGKITNYYYDSNHKIIQFTNANSHSTYYQYNTQGQVDMYWRANNVNKVTLSYGANNTTVVTDSLGNNNTYVFNPTGLLLSHTDPLGNVTQQAWDVNMNKTSLTDARNNVTNFTYDAEGDLIQITDPLNNQTKIAYTSNFNLISSKTDALGNVTSFVYDTKGNLTAITDALGNSHSFAYDQYGDVITTTDSLKHSTNYTYDAYGHVLEKTDALGDKTTFTYDAEGNILAKTDALNHATSFQYDPLNRLLKTTFADASTITFAYDAFGNQISVTDQKGNTLTKTYDAYERLSQTKDPLGGITQFSYDTNGDLLTLTDANKHATTYTYDDDYRVLTQTNALQLATVFTYDTVGNVATRKDANANITTYTYDALNRLTNTGYPDGTSVANVYDAIGRKISMTDSQGQTTYMYDALNRLLSKKAPGVNSTITYTYDSEGNRLTSIDQDNRTITNTYDALNRLALLADTNGTTTYGYDAVSNRTLVKSPNGISESYTYDALNRVLTDVNATSRREVISSFSNVYDIAGMIIKKIFQYGSWTAYSYDALNRLLRETQQIGRSIIYDYVYSYDAVGNRLTWAKNARAYSYNYDAANRLTGYVVKMDHSSIPVVTTAYTYDANGNRISKKQVKRDKETRSEETTYAYDYENRLNKLSYVDVPGIEGTQTDTLTYSGEGLRTQVVLNSVAANYLYDGLNVSVERDASGDTTKAYTRGIGFPGGIGGLIAQNYTRPQRGLSKATVEYYDYNDLGSVANLTTSTGTAASSYGYDAFGNLLTPQASSDTNRYLFSTKELDSHSGLYYFGARYYDSEVGRWLTPDPLGFVDGPNTYLYCLDNPINSVDPYGYWRSPDYYTLTVTVPAPLVTVIGGGLTVSIDRNGNIYAGPVAAVGGPTAGGASLTAGYMNQWDTPTQGQLSGLLTTNSFHGGGGYILGASESWTPGVGTATNFGFFTPGGGAQYSYSWQINNQNSGGSVNQQFAIPPLSAPNLGGKENAAIGESAFNTNF